MSGVSWRTLFPKGLYARSILMTLLPVIIILLLMIIYYYNGHLRAVNLKLSQAVAREVVIVENECASQIVDIDYRSFIAATFGMEFDCDALLVEQNLTQRFFYSDLVEQAIEERLEKEIDLFRDPQSDYLHISFISEGTRRVVLVDRKRAIAINGHIFIVWVVVFSLVMVFAALAFLRNHVRSILRLTEATQAFGRGVDVEGYRPTGAREVRAAARAVIRMRRRLVRFAEQRTKMLAGISHDLRTPLTRLKLQLSILEPSEDIDAAKNDISDMEEMLNEYLAFVRGEDEESSSMVDLSRMLTNIADGYPEARIISKPNESILMRAQPLSLKRALSNLIGNAVAYAGRADISVQSHGGGVTIWVDDDGPGISPDRYDEAMKPFTRLEDSRSQNVPGTGLGLSLANDATRRAGGRLTLCSSPLGGLRVEMKLPL